MKVKPCMDLEVMTALAANNLQASSRVRRIEPTPPSSRTPAPMQFQ